MPEENLTPAAAAVAPVAAPAVEAAAVAPAAAPAVEPAPAVAVAPVVEAAPVAPAPVAVAPAPAAPAVTPAPAPAVAVPPAAAAAKTPVAAPVPELAPADTLRDEVRAALGITKAAASQRVQHLAANLAAARKITRDAAIAELASYPSEKLLLACANNPIEAVRVLVPKPHATPPAK